MTESTNAEDLDPTGGGPLTIWFTCKTLMERAMARDCELILKPIPGDPPKWRAGLGSSSIYHEAKWTSPRESYEDAIVELEKMTR